MKKGVLGIILSILGIISLIYITMDFMTGGASAKNVTMLFLITVLGAGLFFGGIGLTGTNKTAVEAEKVDENIG